MPRSQNPVRSSPVLLLLPLLGRLPGKLTGPVIALLLAGLLQGCASMGIDVFDTPEVELVGLAPLAGSGMEARFLVKLRILNPNPIPLDVDGMAYDLSIRGSKLLSGVSNEGLRVGAYGESIAELEVSAGMLGSLALLRELLSNPPEAGLPYQLNAKLSRKGFGSALRISREGVVDLGNLGGTGRTR